MICQQSLNLMKKKLKYIYKKYNMQESQKQLLLVSQIGKLFELVGRVQKTIFIYDIYSEENLKSLQNLHAISFKLLQPQIQIKIKQKKTKKTTKYFHEVNPNSFLLNENNKIDIFPYQYDVDVKQGQQKAIKAYTSLYKGQKVRIVAIPISENYSKNEEGNKMTQQITNIQKEKYNKTICLPNAQEREALAAKYIEIKQNKEKQFKRKQEKKNQNIFRLQSIIYNFTQKTNKISVCRLLESEEVQLKDAVSMMNVLFNCPEDLKPQYIYHLVDQETYAKDLNNPNGKVFPLQVSTAFGYHFQKEEFSILQGGRDEIFKNIYFTQSKQFSTNIYKIRCRNNVYMAGAISKFVKIWGNIIKQIITPIEPILKGIYLYIFNSLGLQNSVQSLANSLFDKSSNIKIKEIVGKTYRFQQIFAKYKKLTNLQLKEEINQQATNSKDLSQSFKSDQKNYSYQYQHYYKQFKNSQQIEGILFLHYFSKANKQFLAKFTIYDKQKKTNKQLINLIKDHFVYIINLIECINDKILSEQPLKKYKCQNLHKYSQFIVFLLKSSIQIDNITHLSVAITSFIKSFFQALLFADNWFFSYIEPKYKSITRNQSTKYYSLLLKLIKEDCNIQIFSKIQNIFLTIHQYKADKIFQEIKNQMDKDQQIFKANIVEAIQSYSILILGYDKLSPQNQNKNDKLTIQKKVARLLILINKAQQAVKIYQRNHFVTKVDSCFNQVILNYYGEGRTNKFIQFGKYFENEFYYDKAKWYYQKAYDIAISKEGRRKAFICVTKCREREHQISQRKLDIDLVKNYTEKGCSQEDFLASNFGQIKKDIRQEAKIHYQMLRDNKNQWSKNSEKFDTSIKSFEKSQI